MAVTIKEASRSRELTAGKSATSEKKKYTYHAWGSNDPDEVEEQFLMTSPTTVGILVRGDYTIIPRSDADDSIWTIDVDYLHPKVYSNTGTDVQGYQIEVGDDNEYSFDLSTQFARRTHSIQTRSTTVPAGGKTPDHDGGIGFNGETFEGVDIQVPAFGFSVTKAIAADAANTAAYINSLYTVAGKVNSDTFLGFEPGEVLFVGASGSRRGTDVFDITFRFMASENKTGIDIAPGLTVPSKFGWDYVWIQYEDEHDAGEDVINRKPIAAFVEKVYEGADFSSVFGT